MANPTDNVKPNALLKPNMRRNFLLGATLGTAGAVAVAVTGGAVNNAEPEVKVAEAEKKPRGYHTSAHIEQYYDTTRM